MNKESKERIKDMVSLMEEGYGKSITCIDDILDTAFNTAHTGGITAIAKSAESWAEIMATLAKISIGLRIAVDTYAPDLDISNVKTSDMIKVSVRYMESKDEAGVRLEISAGKTGVERLDALIQQVMPIMLSKKVDSLSII